jgi:hypothetical protein
MGSKAQTDIRTTSYDELAARPFGYQGTIDSVIAQIRGEGGGQSHGTQPRAREELLMFLGINKAPSGNGPSVEMDQDVRYGVEPSTEPNIYTLAYAQKHFPDSFARPMNLGERLLALNDSQLRLFQNLRALPLGVLDALARAEAYSVATS